MRILIYLSLMIFAIQKPVLAWGNLCSQIMAFSLSPALSSVYQRVYDLNSELIPQRAGEGQRYEEWTQLYLILKDEAWKYYPEARLPWKSLENLPQQNQSWPQIYPHLDWGQMSGKDRYIFYINSLQSLYQQSARWIAKEFLKVQLGQQAKGRALKELEYLVQAYLQADLDRSATSPDRAREALDRLITDPSVPWSIFYEIIHESLSIETDDLRLWEQRMREHVLFSSLSIDNQRLLLRLSNKPGDSRCCKTNPGCLFCPNNRGFLKDLKNES
jgi:hypothetical protein